jgi:uncharacterized protein YegP (UPF0339 family)
MKKLSTPVEVVKTIKTKKGKWEIYKVKKQFSTRLIARNGYIICSNSGFNTVQNAMKNISAVQSTSV